MNNELYFSKVKPNAIVPSKILENAGYDIYACFDDDYMLIRSLSSRLIPTGIASAFSHNYVLVLKERGSTGVRNLKVNAGIIDSGFRGEIFVCLYNANPYDIVIAKKGAIQGYPFLDDMTDHIYPYEKAIAQALVEIVPEVKTEEIPYDVLLQIESERGLGALGSSNK